MKRMLEQLRRRKDAGFSALETVIGMAVGLILLGGGGMFYVTVNQNASAVNSIQQQGSSVTQVLNRASQNIQVSNPILFAAPNELLVESATASGEPVITRWVKEGSVFHQQEWTGITGAYPYAAAGETTAAPAWIAPGSGTGAAPSGDGTQSTRVAVTELSGTEPIFEYFGEDGDPIDAAAPLTALDGGTNDIKRVGIEIGADTVREGIVTNRTSATPRNQTGGVSDGSLAAPICPAVTATSSSADEPILTWPTITGASEYIVYRNSGVAATVTVPASATEGTWTDTTGPGSAGDAVMYRVLAKIGDTTSESCRPVTWRSRIEAPSFGSADATSSVSPTGVQAAAWTASPLTGPRIDLEWSSVEGASGYELFYRTVDPATGAAASDAYTSAGVFGTDTTTFTWDEAAWGTRYEWYVQASARSGQSSESATIQTLTHPAAPSGAAVSAKYGTGADKDRRGYNVLTWDALPTASTYQIWRYNSGNAGTASLAGSTTALTFTETVEYGSEHTYYVVARNQGPRGSAGSEGRSSATPESAASSAPVKLTQLQYPPIPAIDPATASDSVSSRDLDGENRIVWGEAESAEGYFAMRAGPAESQGACITGICVPGTTGTPDTAIIDDVEPGSQFDYFVKAYNDTGLSIDFSEKVRLTQRPAAPRLKVTDKPDLNSAAADFAITANADAGNTGANQFCTEKTCKYQILRSGDVLDTAAHAESGATVYWNRAGNPDGATVTYQARSKNQALTNSGWSPSAAVTVKTYPGKFALNKWVGDSNQNRQGRFQVDYHHYKNEESTDVDGSRMLRSQAGYTSVSWGSPRGTETMFVKRFDVANEVRSDDPDKALSSVNDPRELFRNNNARIWTRKASPGATYMYRITATAPNGLKRVEETTDFRTPADLPRYAQVMSVCSGYGQEQRSGLHVSNMNFKPRYGDWQDARVRGFEEYRGGGLDWTRIHSFDPSDNFNRVSTGPGKVYFDGMKRGFNIWTNGAGNGPNSVQVQFLQYQFAPFDRDCAPEGRTGLNMEEPYDSCYGRHWTCDTSSDPSDRYNYGSR